MRDILGSLHDASILDIGCGDGSIGLQFASGSTRLFLADLSLDMLAFAKTHTPTHLSSRVYYVVCDFHDIDAAGKFDIVLCLGVLAHVASVTRALSKAATLTKPGGRLIIQFTDDAQLLGRFLHLVGSIRERFAANYRYPLNHLTRGLIQDIARGVGLQLQIEKQYWPQMPGMGRLPIEWSRRFQLFTLRHSALSRLGSERIIVLTRRHARIDDYE